MLDEWNARRQAIAKQYLSQLDATALVLPYVPHWAEPVWHLFVVRSQQRDALQKQLGTAGIGTMIHYPIPPHKQPAYAVTPSTRTSICRSQNYWQKPCSVSP